MQSRQETHRDLSAMSTGAPFMDPRDQASDLIVPVEPDQCNVQIYEEEEDEDDLEHIEMEPPGPELGRNVYVRGWTPRWH